MNCISFILEVEKREKGERRKINLLSGFRTKTKTVSCSFIAKKNSIKKQIQSSAEIKSFRAVVRVLIHDGGVGI